MIWVGLKLSIIQTIGCHLVANPLCPKKIPIQRHNLQNYLTATCNWWWYNELIHTQHFGKTKKNNLLLNKAHELYAEQFQVLINFTSKFPKFLSPKSHSSLLYIVLWGFGGLGIYGRVFGGREIVSQIGKIPREGRQSQVSPHFKSVLRQKFTQLGSFLRIDGRTDGNGQLFSC